MKKQSIVLGALFALAVLLTACSQPPQHKKHGSKAYGSATVATGLEQTTRRRKIPDYSIVKQNIPKFYREDIERGMKESFEEYAPLDKLGRCGVAYARVGPDTMPTEKRGPIGMIKPTGWQYSKYDFIDGRYLYNRCHLIGFQLAGENANPRNLITCTRHMNAIGMLPFENQVAEYVRRTGNHVLYRVTPAFIGDNLVAKGVFMEAWSLEDHGTLHFYVYVHNIQPDVVIDYSDGSNHLEENWLTSCKKFRNALQYCISYVVWLYFKRNT